MIKGLSVWIHPFILFPQEVLAGSDNLPTMYPDLFDQLLTFVDYAVRPPKFGKVDAKSITAVTSAQVHHNGTKLLS